MAPNPKVAKAFRAMGELGIPEEKTKSVLKNLLKIYDKNWELIEEENYGALADAIFDSKEAEAAEQKNKVEQAELMKVIEEETQIPEEPERPLKRLWLRHQKEPSGTGSSFNSHVTPLKKPKLEIDDLPYAILRSQARSMALTGEPASAQTEDTDEGKQPVLPNTFLGDVEISQPDVRNESGSGASVRPTHRRDKGKEPILTQSGRCETRSGSDRPSQRVPFKEPEPKQTDISLIKPKDGPGTEITPLEVPLSVIRPESLTNGGSSNEIDLPKEADQPQSADNESSSNKIRGHELAMIPKESTKRLDIVSSSSGEIKILSNCNSTVKANLSVDALLMKMEGKCLNSYKFLEPSFSIKETNSIPPTDSWETCASNTNADTNSHANADTSVTAEANANGSGDIPYEVSVLTRKIEKPRVCNDDSYFCNLPDDIVLLILNKILDLKTLCLCKLVSTQFNLIIHQVDTISFVASRADNPSCDSNPTDDAGLHFLSNPYHLPASEHGIPASSFKEFLWSTIQSLRKFTRLKSLCIELPSFQKDVDNGTDLYKWKVKFGSKVESFVFLFNGQEEEQDGKGLHFKKLQLTYYCLVNAAVRFWMLLNFTYKLPSLEKVLITQSGKRGSVSISGKNIVEMRKWLSSLTPDRLEQELSDSMDLPNILEMRRCCWYVPLLKLPVSGYEMKGVTLYTFQREDLVDGDDSFMNINLDDDFEDKEEAAYGEAMMEMLKKLRSQR